MTTQKLDFNIEGGNSRTPKRIEYEVLSRFYYDETSPSYLRWACSPSPFLKIKSGDVAGCKTKAGYWTVKSGGRLYKVHRIIYALNNSSWDQCSVIDHKDRNKSNNNKSNLRDISIKFNNQNSSMTSSNKSGVTGVYIQCGNSDYWSWVASVRDVCGKYRRKTFGIPKFGNEGAFKLACEAREQMVTHLNNNGMQYTESHGK